MAKIDPNLWTVVVAEKRRISGDASGEDCEESVPGSNGAVADAIAEKSLEECTSNAVLGFAIPCADPALSHLSVLALPPPVAVPS